jgi:hypothetical protein
MTCQNRMPLLAEMGATFDLPAYADRAISVLTGRYSGSLRIVQGDPAVAAGANGGRTTSACANDRLAKSELSW